MKKKISFFILLITCILSANASDYLYKIADKPWNEGFGNHRAVIEVKKKSNIVKLKLEWRRPDKEPEKRRFIIVNAETGDTIKNIIKKQINNERCSLIFGPATAGIYYFYYLPYKVQTGGGFYSGDYLPDNIKNDLSWNAMLSEEKDSISSANVIAIESRTQFDSFYPMEVIATASEVSSYCKKYACNWFTFPEDRRFPIKMKKYLPKKWMNYNQDKKLSGIARPYEYYTFQIGIWSPTKNINNLTYKSSDLICGSSRIPSSHITCFNTEGINSKGVYFKKALNIKAGNVQPLWFGIDIPSNISTGIYKGKITINCEEDKSFKQIPIEIEIKGEKILDRGDSEPWRHSRLRWLNSKLGNDTIPIPPYTDIILNKNNTITCLGRSFIINNKTGLPTQINSWNSNILSSPLRFIIETEKGIKKLNAHPILTSSNRTQIQGKWHASDNEIDLLCNFYMEFDGWANYIYTINPKTNIKVKDIRLELPIRKEIAAYFLGAGLSGQETPDSYEGKWDIPETNMNNNEISIPINKSSDWLWPFDSFWIGNTHAGIHCELRGSSYSGPLLNSYRPTYPESWNNNGKGGFRIRNNKKTTIVTIYSGERILTTNEPIKFDFAILITPVKQLDTKSQFTNRYYHNGSVPTPTESDIDAGVRIINVHHANVYNPYINYPFLTIEKTQNFISQWHNKGCKVKLYYTLRELTSAVTELWAIRSLGNEILRGGNGGGYPWCREHLIDDYTPQWYQHFEDKSLPISADAALLTSEKDSRWYNYYIEGLRWMVENLDIDGIYMDDVSFGRDILKRMRRAMNGVKSGCIIDLHSNTGFSRGPANQYAEFFPYIDKIWFGESFLYDQMSPTNWLVESSGIPFGLMGDMLHRGGNKWLGMQYGMTVRLPWYTEGVLCDPRIVWKIWDSFDIANSTMIGFWEKDIPIKTNDSDVKVTIYKKKGKILISMGNYSNETKYVKLKINWKKLDLSPTQTKLLIPEIKEFQQAQIRTVNDIIIVEAKKGLLMYLEQNL